MAGCVIPGSFDPVTRGHMDLIRRAAKLFDRVTVVVMVNVHKQGVFSPEERMSLLAECTAEMPGVRIRRWDGLLAEYMRQNGESIVLRGVRGAVEFDGESLAAAANRKLYPGMETLLMPSADELSCVSSSAVREIAAFGGDIRPFVPKEVAEEIAERLSK